MQGSSRRPGLGRMRVAALIEWAKGLVVGAAALGVLTLVDPALRPHLLSVLDRFHFAGRAAIESSWLDALGRERSVVALIALLYVAIRAVEGAGLWLGRAWARWLGIASCLAYLVIETWHVLVAPGWIGAGAIVVTLVLLALLWPPSAPQSASLERVPR